MRGAIIRTICALACALAFHAALIAGAVYLGLSTNNTTTLPELDLTSVDLSFSETPEETAPPVAQPPPSPAVEAPPPTPPPPVFEPPLPPPAVELPPLPSATPPPPPTIEPPPLPDIEPPPPKPLDPPPQDPQEKEPPKPQENQIPTPQPPAAAPPPTPAPSQARVAVDKKPSPLRKIKPEYPKGARQRGEEGDVTLEFEVSAKGSVSNVRIVKSCGFPELEQAAIQAVKHARFTPARHNSANVPSTARIKLTFSLKD